MIDVAVLAAKLAAGQFDDEDDPARKFLANLVSRGLHVVESQTFPPNAIMPPLERKPMTGPNVLNQYPSAGGTIKVPFDTAGSESTAWPDPPPYISPNTQPLVDHVRDNTNPNPEVTTKLYRTFQAAGDFDCVTSTRITANWSDDGHDFQQGAGSWDRLIFCTRCAAVRKLDTVVGGHAR